jgi:hypothetical protein
VLSAVQNTEVFDFLVDDSLESNPPSNNNDSTQESASVVAPPTSSGVVLTGQELNLGKWFVYRKFFDDEAVDLLYPQNGNETDTRAGEHKALILCTKQ